MNFRVLSVLAGFLVVIASALSGAEEKPVDPSQKTTAAKKLDVRAILESGQAANSLPADVCVRVEAHLVRLGSETKRHAAGPELTFQESWEFTANTVHRVIIEYPEKSGDDTIHRRVESIPFDANGLCKELLDAKIFAIGDETKGERPQFVGTEYDVGHRSIEILLNGKSVLYVGESCTCAGFAESDARTFATLYEELAKKARGAYEAKRAHTGQTK